MVAMLLSSTLKVIDRSEQTFLKRQITFTADQRLHLQRLGCNARLDYVYRYLLPLIWCRKREGYLS